MTKKIPTLFFLLITMFGFSQTSTLIQNINYRAKELKHSLNATGDSLILDGERTIFKVAIFNDNFEETYRAGDTFVKVPLNNIPLGRFVIEATLRDKLIVITLLRNENISPVFENPVPALDVIVSSEEPTISSHQINIYSEEPIISSEEFITTSEESTSFITKLPNPGKTIKKTLDTKPEKIISNVKEVKHLPRKRTRKSYWIEYEVKNGYSSRKIFRMGDQKIVDQLISQIELDIKTATGKGNQLTIWEVYDTTAFMKLKRINSGNLNVEADCFKKVPYYNKRKNPSNI